MNLSDDTSPPSPAPKTGFATAALVLGLLSLPTLGLALVGALLAIIFGIAAIVKARQQPGEYGGADRAAWGIGLAVLSILIAPVLVVTGIAGWSVLFGSKSTSVNPVPRLAPEGEERLFIADARALQKAQDIYQVGNDGFYGRLQCLQTPAACPGAYSGPPLLPAEIATLETRNGYQRVYWPDDEMVLAVAKGKHAAAGVSARGTRQYLYIGTPRGDNSYRNQAYCADHTGRICISGETSPSFVGDLRCPEDCTDIGPPGS